MADEQDVGMTAPIMPTGSGVADLEIAREQDALAADGPLTGDDGFENGGGLAADGALTGAIGDEAGLDATDEAAEAIIPPEQAPMDDAAGGPQARE